MIKRIIASAVVGLALVGVSASADSHTVVEGDTLGEIAKSLDTTVEHLATTNDIDNINLIYVGEIIETHGSEVTVKHSEAPTASGNKDAEYVAQRMSRATGISVDKWRDVIFRESGNNAYITNPTGHFGYLQIAPVHNLQDKSVDGQINKAIEIYNAQGGNAWEVW